MSEYVFHHYRGALARALAAALGTSAAEIESSIKPAEPVHGDFAFATFALAKVQKRAPQTIAASLAQSLSVPGMQISAAGPYVNARLSASPYTGEVLQQVRQMGERYGSGDSGAGRTVVIDYSSPNIAKPIAFHHIRSTVIGHSLANLYRNQGFRVEGINYLGDWGKQFGLVAVGFEEYGDP